MKRSSAISACLAASLAVVVLNSSAASLWWDPVPGTAGPGDGAGFWGNASANLNWWDGAANVPWNSGDTAVFGVNSNIAVTVTITNKVVAGGIIFTNAGTAAYTIAGGSTTSIPIAANTNLTLSGSSPSVTLMAHDISQGQVVEVISASVIAPGGLSVLANTTTTNSFVRFANITNNIVGSLVIGTPGNGSYGGTTALYCDFNTPTTTDVYASLLNNTTNVTVHSNASFRISNHNSGSIGTVQWPKRLTLSGYGRNGLSGAWVITGNVGDNFVTDLVLAGDSLIDINAGAANKVYTLFGVISGSGNLTVVSANSTANRHTLVLTNASTFAGNLTIGGGTTLQLINGDNRLPSTAALTLGIGASAPVANWNAYGRLVLGNAGRAVNQTLAGLNSDSAVALCRVVGGNSTNLSWLTVNSAASNYFGGAFGGTGVAEKNVGLLLNGGGTLTLAGTNIANGGFTVSAGTLEFGDGFTDAPVAGPITNNAAVVFNTAGSLTYADTLTGTGPLTKRGGGTAALTGQASYAGATTVVAGKLSLATTKSGTGAINVGSGANLEVKRTAATASITAASSTLDGARLDFNFNNLGLNSTAALNVIGTLANSGSTTIYIAAPGGLVVGSYPLIKYGNYQSNDFSAITLGAAISPRVTAAIQDNPANKSIDLVISAVDYLKWSGATDGNWDTMTPNWILSSSGLPTTYGVGDFARFDDTASGTTSLTISSDPMPGSVLVTNSGKEYTFGGFVGIGGAGALIKQGNGKLTVATPFNSYSGGTIIEGGVLQVGDGTADGMLPDGIKNDGSLAFNVASLAAANFISGTGSVSKAGPGALTLGGDNTYGGATTVTSGSLKVASSAALGAASAGTTVSPGAEIWVDAGGLSIPEPLSLSGSGGGGGGALVVYSGASTWSAPVEATGDTLLAALSGTALTMSGGIAATSHDLLFDAQNSGYFLIAEKVSAASVALTNTGGLHLSAPNPSLTNIQNLGPVTYGSSPPITSGLWARHSLALGTNSIVTITNGNHIGDTGTQLGLDNNVNIPAEVSLQAYCPGDGLEGQGGYRASLSVRTSTTNAWNGAITIHGPDPILGVTSLFILNGGNSGTSGRLVVNGDISIVDGPVNLMPRGWSSGQFNGRLNLGTNVFVEVDGARWTVASTGNTWRETQVGSSTATLVVGANDALPVTAPVSLTGTLELNGFNQRVAGVYGPLTGVVVNHSTNAHSTLTIQATTNWTFDGALVLSGVAGAKHFGLDLASGGLTLTRNGNSYAGQTVIRGGATLSLTNTGDITATSPITVQSGGIFDVSGRTEEIYAPFTPASHFRLSGDRILMGDGTVNGAVVVADTSTLAPGASIGVLTVTSNVLFNAGKAWMEVNNTSGTSDLLSVGGTLTYGGMLVVTNISPTPFTNNQVIKLFNATGGYSGSFGSIVFPGITYDASQLIVDGTIRVVSTTPTTPTNVTYSVSSNNLVLTWPASYTGWRLEAQTNSTGAGLGNIWFTVPGSTSVNTVTMPVDPNNGAVFYRLVYP